jgi:hypothetical protein
MVTRKLLALLLLGSLALMALPAMAQSGTIEYGQTVEGELTEDEIEVEYTFMGTEGDVIIAEHISDDYDSYLTLEFDGDEIASNDDGAGNLDSRIGPFTLEDTGEYTLLLRPLDNTTPGDFELRLQLARLVEVTYGKATSVDIGENDTTVFFSFEAEAGDVIDILVDGEVDTDAQLNDPSGYYVAQDTDSGSGDNPEIVAQSLSTEGVYTLVLTVEDPGDTGSVEVTINAAELASLNNGPLTLEFDSGSYEHTFEFDVVEDVTYRLTFVLTEGDEGSPSLNLSLEGESLGYTSASRVQRLSFDLTPDDDGTVVVAMSEYAFDDIAYEITLEEVAE